MNKQTEISADQLRLLIVEEGKKLHEMLTRKRKELCGRYNEKNEFELMYQKFVDPRVNPDIFYIEYCMILQKKSKLPASIRYTIQKIMDAVIFNFVLSQQKRKIENDEHT